jgi:NADPH-dependent glutamate synthase beta subunit-like oxidoreductase/glutamate synthase domain-containing protein 3/Pyruvate/2-oxoacid:ferredoxin oxidoreductase delta subunit
MSDKSFIKGVINEKRVSTQNLLKEIYNGLESGIREFDIDASGQHNIGGPLWAENGEQLVFNVKNPGQRVGSMGMPNTTIVVDGSAPADVGWLNAGAEIIVKGDGGDTSAHCAASGKIYIGGKSGTRSGALMKYDPRFSVPEFWVLKNVGSFSFEFMGGGYAVVCGYGVPEGVSVLGDRSCVGMVGGVVYVRGFVSGLSSEVWLLRLDDNDKEFLTNGLRDFVNKIDRPEIYEEIADMSQWHKIVAKTHSERHEQKFISAKDFRLKKWVEGGIFGELIQDDYKVSGYVSKGADRLRIPEWNNAKYSAPCEYNCPVFIPTQKRIGLLRQDRVKEALELVLEHSPFPASVCGQVCPNLCMDDCNRVKVDIPVKIKELGILSKDIEFKQFDPDNGRKVAVIGSGAAGLSASWQLRQKGYAVDVFEADSVAGGKLMQVIPQERLERNILQTEIERVIKSGVRVKTNTRVDKVLFANLCQNYEAVVVAVGAHNPVVIPFEGHERLIKGLDFLKQINKGERPNIGKKVVVIGAGNAAMDVIIGAYQLGAIEVTAVDIQKPAAFDKELEHVEHLGAKILYPKFTEKVTDKGIHFKDGSFIEADTIIISVGDRADFSFFENGYLNEKGMAKVNEFMQSEYNSKVFITGDAVKQGLFTHALGDGRKAAINIDKMLNGKALDSFKRAPVIPSDRVKDEFYHPMNANRLEEMKTEDETKRCMSCGFCRDCSFCRDICPEQAITRLEKNGKFEYVSDSKKCIGCGICAGVCPCGVWSMADNLIKYMES